MHQVKFDGGLSGSISTRQGSTSVKPLRVTRPRLGLLRMRFAVTSASKVSDLLLESSALDLVSKERDESVPAVTSTTFEKRRWQIRSHS